MKDESIANLWNANHWVSSRYYDISGLKLDYFFSLCSPFSSCCSFFSFLFNSISFSWCDTKSFHYSKFFYILPVFCVVWWDAEQNLFFKSYSIHCMRSWCLNRMKQTQLHFSFVDGRCKHDIIPATFYGLKFKFAHNKRWIVCVVRFSLLLFLNWLRAILQNILNLEFMMKKRWISDRIDMNEWRKESKRHRTNHQRNVFLRFSLSGKFSIFRLIFVVAFLVSFPSFLAHTLTHIRKYCSLNTKREFIFFCSCSSSSSYIFRCYKFYFQISQKRERSSNISHKNFHKNSLTLVIRLK